MNITKWDPFRELDAMMDLGRLGRRLANRDGGGHEAVTTADWAPVCDIHETETEYVIEAEVPKVEKQDVKVSVNNGVLLLQGSRKIEKEEKDKKFHRIERAYGSFARSFTLPEDVSEEEIKAEHKDGVLTVHLPKQSKPKAKSIEINVN